MKPNKANTPNPNETRPQMRHRIINRDLIADRIRNMWDNDFDALAELVGVTPQAIRKWADKQSVPHGDTLDRARIALRFKSVDDMYTFPQEVN